MIHKIHGLFHLECDVCGQEARINFGEFQGAVDFKKREGWKSRRHNGRWEDVCSECQEKEGE